MTVYSLGAALTIVPSILLLLPKDNKTIAEKSEGIQDDDKSMGKDRSKWVKNKHVPLVLFTFDFVICIGAGMTVKFFPLWMMDEV